MFSFQGSLGISGDIPRFQVGGDEGDGVLEPCLRSPTSSVLVLCTFLGVVGMKSRSFRSIA
jgi:hypothetical protein